MKLQTSLSLILILTFSSCMSQEYVVKYPRMGIESTTSVGEQMIYFNYGHEGSLTIGMKEAIVYKGIANNVITLSFRKWTMGSKYNSEPPSQDFQYTLANSGEPTEVTVGGYKIRVIEANNNSIKFVLLSGMPNVKVGE